MNIDSAIGAPNDRVTHWGISRIMGYKRSATGKRSPVYERETAPRGDGVRINEWPIEECTLETVREKWGTGEFRCHWFILDPEHEDPKQRRIGAGNGLIFELDEVGEIATSETVEAVHGPAAPPPFLQQPDPMSSGLQFTERFLGMIDRRTEKELEVLRARGVGDHSQSGGNADILAHIARLEAKMEADRIQREIEDRHRAELAQKDKEIDDLKRAKEKAEEDAAKGGDGPAFDPELSMWDQLPAVAINGVLGLAKTNPDIATALMEKGYELFERFQARKSPPAPPPAAVPAAMAGGAPARPSPVVHIVPRRADDPLTPVRTARAADPPATAPPQAPVVESSGATVDVGN